MGSYAQAWLGNFFVGSSKNEIDPSIIHLFRRSDKRVVSSLQTRDLPKRLQDVIAQFEGHEDPFDLVYYSIPTRVLRDRLELFGYTIVNCRQAFEIAVADEISTRRDWGHVSVDLPVLEALTPDVWCDGLRSIAKSGLQPNFYGRFDRNDVTPLERYMLSEEWYGLPGVDRNIGLRLALEVTEEAEEFIYDVTDLVLGEYYQPDDDLVSYGFRDAANEFTAWAKTIVLTEGKSDASLFSEALALLYPHLADYFSFMDFDGSRAAGGVGNLVNMVKAFAGAGIVNRSIAIFDNDTAATSALRSLANIQLPKHMAIIRLPVLEVLNSYPTLGPTGVVTTNVNGLAVGAELVLGMDVLTDEEYELIPVQWTGYEQALGQYQGEVLNKVKIQDRFREKVRAIKSGTESIDNKDWTGLRALFQSMFCAFHDLDGDEIKRLAAMEL